MITLSPEKKIQELIKPIKRMIEEVNTDPKNIKKLIDKAPKEINKLKNFFDSEAETRKRLREMKWSYQFDQMIKLENIKKSCIALLIPFGGSVSLSQAIAYIKTIKIEETGTILNMILSIPSYMIYILLFLICFFIIHPFLTSEKLPKNDEEENILYIKKNIDSNSIEYIFKSPNLKYSIEDIQRYNKSKYQNEYEIREDFEYRKSAIRTHTHIPYDESEKTPLKNFFSFSSLYLLIDSFFHITYNDFRFELIFHIEGSNERNYGNRIDIKNSTFYINNEKYKIESYEEDGSFNISNEHGTFNVTIKIKNNNTCSLNIETSNHELQEYA